MDLSSALEALGLNTQSLLTVFLTSLSGLAIYLGYQLTRKIRAYFTPPPPSEATETLINIIRHSSLRDWEFTEGGYTGNYIDRLSNDKLGLVLVFNSLGCKEVKKRGSGLSLTQGIHPHDRKLICQTANHFLKSFKEFTIHCINFGQTFKQSPPLTDSTLAWINEQTPGVPANRIDSGHPYPSEGDWRKFDKK